MAQATQPYKRSLSGSIGSGMKSVLGGNDRRFYVLEHKVSSQYHKAGESQRIIVDQIEIGRGQECQVRFDESFTTVSRRHAAIVKDGENWKLVQLSQTNSTYLNGRRVEKEWYLQSGDEIQLSTNGPKLGFIVPQGDKGLVKSIGLTARMNLFRQQALRPYKTAITVLSCVLILSVGLLTFLNIGLQRNVTEQGNMLAEQINENITNKARADSLANELDGVNRELKDYQNKLAVMRKEVAAARSQLAEAIDRVNTVQPSVGNLKEYAQYVYFCGLIISCQGEDIGCYTGTAFLLDDGRLVTAQHVVNPILYPDLRDETSLKLNAMINQYPDAFSFKFIAVSPSGDRIEKSFNLQSNPFNMGQYELEVYGTIEIDGNQFAVKGAKDFACDYRDYAWIKTNKSGGLKYDAAFSTSLPIKTHLDILGFPQGVGAEDLRNISPIYSESTVARDGLDVDGCILLSNSETDHGNSGGPVFASKDGTNVVVGILSGANMLGTKTQHKSTDGKWKDRVVPISVIK